MPTLIHALLLRTARVLPLPQIAGSGIEAAAWGDTAVAGNPARELLSPLALVTVDLASYRARV